MTEAAREFEVLLVSLQRTRLLPSPVQRLTQVVESFKKPRFITDVAPKLDRFLQSTQPDRELSPHRVEETEVRQWP